MIKANRPFGKFAEKLLKHEIMTRIENIDELLGYIEANYDQLDQNKLCEIVSESIGFFIRRPDTFKEAKHEILKYWNRWKDTPFQDRAFFEVK